MRQSLSLLALSVFSLTLLVSGDAQSDPTPQKASMGEIVEAAMQPLEADPTIKYVASSAGTDQEDLIGSDLATAEKTIRYSQEITVINLSTTVSVCTCSTTWALTCSALSCSCRGGAAPSSIIPPGQAKVLRYAGTRRPCAVTSAIAGEWQAERSTILVGAR